MEINEVKNTLETAGFSVERLMTDDITGNDALIYKYTAEGFQHGSIIINGFDLYASDFEYFKIEISKDAVVVRLYHDIHYIGCHVELTEDLETFEIKPFGRD